MKLRSKLCRVHQKLRRITILTFFLDNSNTYFQSYTIKHYKNRKLDAVLWKFSSIITGLCQSTVGCNVSVVVEFRQWL